MGVTLGYMGFRVWGLGFRVSQNEGYTSGVPATRTAHSIWGSILGSPYLEKLPNAELRVIL